MRGAECRVLRPLSLQLEEHRPSARLHHPPSDPIRKFLPQDVLDRSLQDGCAGRAISPAGDDLEHGAWPLAFPAFDEPSELLHGRIPRLAVQIERCDGDRTVQAWGRARGRGNRRPTPTHVRCLSSMLACPKREGHRSIEARVPTAGPQSELGSRWASAWSVASVWDVHERRSGSSRSRGGTSAPLAARCARIRRSSVSRRS